MRNLIGITLIICGFLVPFVVATVLTGSYLPLLLALVIVLIVILIAAGVITLLTG